MKLKRVLAAILAVLTLSLAGAGCVPRYPEPPPSPEPSPRPNPY